MAIKNKVQVPIAGRLMTLVGTESEEYLYHVAEYINAKLQEIREADSSKSLSASMVSVLTSINIADDYFKELENNKKLQEENVQLKTEIEQLKQHCDQMKHHIETMKGQLQATKNNESPQPPPQTTYDITKQRESDVSAKEAFYIEKIAFLEQQKQELEEKISQVSDKAAKMVLEISRSERDESKRKEQITNALAQAAQSQKKKDAPLQISLFSSAHSSTETKDQPSSAVLEQPDVSNAFSVNTTNALNDPTSSFQHGKRKKKKKKRH